MASVAMIIGSSRFGGVGELGGAFVAVAGDRDDQAELYALICALEDPDVFVAEAAEKRLAELAADTGPTRKIYAIASDDDPGVAFAKLMDIMRDAKRRLDEAQYR